MGNKKIRTLAIISLCLLVAAGLFMVILLACNVYGESIRKVEGGNDNIGESISVGCGAVINLMFIAFALIVKAVGALLGVSCLFVKRKLGAIITVGTFTAVIAILALAISTFSFISYFEVADTNTQAFLIKTAMIACIATDLLWAVSVILNTVTNSKAAKRLKAQEAQSEVDN